jgi:hypothetical protein
MKKACLFKSALAVAIVLLGALVSYCLAVSPPQKTSGEGHETVPLEASRQASRGGVSSTVTLTVHILPTDDSAGRGMGLYVNRYPKTVRVENATAFADRIAAYGAAFHVWIAPKGWTGSANSGGDASRFVSLYPVNGSAKSGPRFQYEDTGGCAGCAIDEAAAFFPSAAQGYDEPGPPSAAPPGLKVTSRSPSLVTYTLPNLDGLMVRGVAYFNGSDSGPFFEKADFVLPDKDAKLMSFLVHTFIRREKLK